MPPLVACGRIWEFGSDDLVFPGIASITLRVFWFIGVVIGVALFHSALTCQPSHLLGAFSFTVLGMIIVTIVLESAITIFSTRGTIVRAKPRKPVVHLLHLRLFMFLLECLLLILGTIFAFLPQNEEEYESCEDLDKAVLTTQVIVGLGWAVVIIVVIFFLIYLDPCHCYSAKVNYESVERHVRNGSLDHTTVQHHWRLTHSVWEKRFRVACCIAGTDDSHQHAYGEVAEIFAHVFCDTNVVLSDIAAGMVLLQKEHLTREEENRHFPTGSTEELRSVDFNNLADLQTFKQALHYIKFAMAPYSWPLYAYMNPVLCCCNLLSFMQFCPCQRRARPHIIKDNSCFCYLAGVRKISGLNEMDIMYASFENDLYRVPFIVCLDHTMQSVVIAVRGTLSMHDIITDLTASTEAIGIPDHPTFLVHKGMLKTATWLVEKLDELEILETAFGKVNNYQLVVTGHSLGSGVACVSSILLRDRYPDLHCYCFSPTGSLVNETAAEYTRSFVTSVTLGQDMVARLSVSTGHILKADIIRVLENCNKPKCQILVEGMLETICKCVGRPMVIEDSRIERDNEDEEAAMDAATNISNPEDSLEFTPLVREGLSSLSRGRGVSFNSEIEDETSNLPLIPLYPPGNIIHLVDSSDNVVSFCGTRQLQAHWAPRTNFQHIMVSPDMLRDHLPNVLLGAMQYIWQQKMTEMEDAHIPIPTGGETSNDDGDDSLRFHP